MINKIIIKQLMIEKLTTMMVQFESKMAQLKHQHFEDLLRSDSDKRPKNPQNSLIGRPPCC